MIAKMNEGMDATRTECREREVVERLLQGEVEQISLMKSKSQTPHETGLLEYLEDIIGTDKYVERIEECARQ